jgi:translation initiation factor 2B subunit (eIF-2B alpha/beta/delta family)
VSRAARAPVLEALADDRRRGAAEIAARLLEWARRWSAGGCSPERARAGLAEVARAQAALAPVLRIANDLLVEIERHEGGEEASAWRGVGTVATAWEERLSTAAETLLVHARRSLQGASIVHTYSASSTVRAALLAHAETGAWFQVVLSESRPGGEGARLAVALGERGIPVRLGVDAWLWGAIEEEGILLLGADALLPTAWVNKIGTGALAERARSKSVPVVVCADTSKWLPPALAALPRVYDRDPGEIVFRAPAALEAVNVYFEDVPYAALDKLVTERGVTRPQDLRMGDVVVARSLGGERGRGSA